MYPLNYSTLPTAVRCRRCQIGIATDEAEAWSLRIPFSPLVNTRVGDLCIGCAAGDDQHRIDELAVTLLEENLMKGKAVSDEEIGEAWRRLINGCMETECVDVAADQLGIGRAALTMRLRKLGLTYPGRRKLATDGRVPHIPTPMNGNGHRAEAAVAEAEVEFDWNKPSANVQLGTPPTTEEIVTAAEGVGAPTLVRVQTVAEDAPVLPALPPPDPLAGLRAFLADAHGLGASVQVSGKISIEITF